MPLLAEMIGFNEIANSKICLVRSPRKIAEQGSQLLVLVNDVFTIGCCLIGPVDRKESGSRYWETHSFL
jgi:hypothetical protein